MSKHDEQFTAYVVERRPHLYRTAFLLCGDAHHAEDVVQQTLVKLYSAWPRVARADSVDAYARRTLVNAYRDEVRRPWRRERPTDDVGEHPARDPASLEDADALWRALRALSPGQRRVVVLRHLLGLSVDETAADLGVSPGTVKRQSSDALNTLRKTLTNGAPW